jgi:hypothetical protein
MTNALPVFDAEIVSAPGLGQGYNLGHGTPAEATAAIGTAPTSASLGPWLSSPVVLSSVAAETNSNPSTEPRPGSDNDPFAALFGQSESARLDGASEMGGGGRGQTVLGVNFAGPMNIAGGTLGRVGGAGPADQNLLKDPGVGLVPMVLVTLQTSGTAALLAEPSTFTDILSIGGVSPSSGPPSVGSHDQQGGADQVLVGGEGDDIQIGAEGRDMLIGGIGSSMQSAASVDYLAIAASSDVEINDLALQSLVHAWTTGDSGVTALGQDVAGQDLSGGHFADYNTMLDG